MNAYNKIMSAAAMTILGLQCFTAAYDADGLWAILRAIGGFGWLLCGTTILFGRDT